MRCGGSAGFLGLVTVKQRYQRHVNNGYTVVYWFTLGYIGILDWATLVYWTLGYIGILDEGAFS